MERRTPLYFLVPLRLWVGLSFLIAHCMHGMGRTGTILACILGREQQLSSEQAIAAVRAERPGSVESDEQVAFIAAYLA